MGTAMTTQARAGGIPCRVHLLRAANPPSYVEAGAHLDLCTRPEVATWRKNMRGRVVPLWSRT
jgi:hypothetical protein